MMAKYMVQGSYSLEGHKGLLKDGGSSRREATAKAVESIGGRVEAFYFTFGADDFVVIFDAPDNVSAAAVALTAAASGAVRSRMTVLLTPQEIDQAAKKSVAYRPPGQ